MGAHGTSAGDPTRHSPRGKKQPGFLQSWGWKTPWFGARSHAPVHARWNWERVSTPHLLLESLQSHWSPRAQGASCPSRACHSSQKCLLSQKSPSGNTHPAANAGGQPGKAALWLIYPDPQNILGLRGGTSGTWPHGCGAEEDESVLLSPSPAPFQGLWNTGIQEPSACLAAEAK